MSQPPWHDPERTVQMPKADRVRSRQNGPHRPRGDREPAPPDRAQERRGKIFLGIVGAVGVLVLLLVVLGNGSTSGSSDPSGTGAGMTTPLGCEVTERLPSSVSCTAAQIASRVCDLDYEQLFAAKQTSSASGGYFFRYRSPSYVELSWNDAPKAGIVIVNCSSGQRQAITALTVQTLLRPGTADQLPPYLR